MKTYILFSLLSLALMVQAGVPRGQVEVYVALTNTDTAAQLNTYLLGNINQGNYDFFRSKYLSHAGNGPYGSPQRDCSLDSIRLVIKQYKLAEQSLVGFRVLLTWDFRNDSARVYALAPVYKRYADSSFFYFESSVLRTFEAGLRNEIVNGTKAQLMKAVNNYGTFNPSANLTCRIFDVKKAPGIYPVNANQLAAFIVTMALDITLPAYTDSTLTQPLVEQIQREKYIDDLRKLTPQINGARQYKGNLLVICEGWQAEWQEDKYRDGVIIKKDIRALGIPLNGRMVWVSYKEAERVITNEQYGYKPLFGEVFMAMFKTGFYSRAKVEAIFPGDF